MRRRFGRRRGAVSGDGRPAPIDAEAALARIASTGLTPATELAPVDLDQVPGDFAVVGEGRTEGGQAVLVGYAPGARGDAALAVLAEARRRGEDFDGEAIAVAPQWSTAARRRLGLIAADPVRLRALVACGVAEGDGAVSPAALDDASPVAVRHVAGAVAPGPRGQLFQRALAALEGLSAKHGGSVRAAGSRVELVLMARRVASLVDAADGVVLEVVLPERFTATLARADELATALDRLEGLLRKRLNDRRVRGGEEGLRADALPALAAILELGASARWPLCGSDPDVLDLVGLDADGRLVAGYVRERLTLPGLAAILDSVAALPGCLPVLADALERAPRSGLPSLAITARGFDEPALQVCGALALGCTLYDVDLARGGEVRLSLRGESSAAAPAPRVASEAGPEASAEAVGEAPREGPVGRGRRRGGRSSRRGRGGRAAYGRPEAEGAAVGSSVAAGGAEREEPAAGEFEEMSLFDLDEERGADIESEPPGSRRRRRGRGRRRGRRGGAPESAGAEGQPDDGARDRGRSSQGARDDVDDDDDDDADAFSTDDLEELPETLAPLAEDVPEIEEPPPLPYDDEEEGGAAAEADEEVAPEIAPAADGRPEAAPRPARAPRRRAAVVAHADRASVVSAILLARDIRLLEGFWVYPQNELMTFFRSVATDLREDAPLYVVGFTASPARETLQAAALYRGRLTWYDHHDWPPEDLGGLREAIGEEFVQVRQGAESCLPSVLAASTRRSRFSDKLVELVSGRFTEHDYARWGRVWWQRLGEIAGRSGERRADIEPLLAGRPSDLAREAAQVPPPPLPEEVAFVSRRDFRLVHFGSYSLVVLPTPPELDWHLVGRLARERYGAQLSLAYREGSELVVLGADETRAQRGLHLSGLVEHLASKHAWIEALPGEDRVASLRLRGLPDDPERLDEVLREIAMGRSLLEG